MRGRVVGLEEVGGKWWGVKVKRKGWEGVEVKCSEWEGAREWGGLRGSGLVGGARELVVWEGGGG